MNFKFKGKLLAVFILTLALVMILGTSVFATPSEDLADIFFIAAETSGSGEGYTYTKEGTKGTLTLDDYSGEGGIGVLGIETLEVVLAADTTNTITLNNLNGSGTLQGIYSDGDLVISGSGTLNIEIDAPGISVPYDGPIALYASKDIIIKDSAVVNISVESDSDKIYAIYGYRGIKIQDTANVDIFVENSAYISYGLYAFGGGIDICSTGDQVITMSGNKQHIAIHNDATLSETDENDIVISGANLEMNFPVEYGIGFANDQKTFGKLEILNGSEVVINNGDYGIYDNTLAGADGIKIEDSTFTASNIHLAGIFADVNGVDIIDSNVNINSNFGSAIQLWEAAETSKVDISGSSIVNFHSVNIENPVDGKRNISGEGVSEINLSAGGIVTLTTDKAYADYVWNGLVRLSETTKLKEGVAFGGGDTPEGAEYAGADIYRVDDTTGRLVFASKSGFEIEVPTFDEASEGYEIAALPIAIEAVGGDRTIKSVTIDNETYFELIDADSVIDTLVADGDSIDVVTIKPVEGLPYGNYETTVTVTDSEDNTYIATVTFSVTSPKRIYISCSDDYKNINTIHEYTILTLVDDVTLDEETISSIGNQDTIRLYADAVLDLNGHTLTMPDHAVKAFFYRPVKFVVTSSVPNGKILSTGYTYSGPFDFMMDTSTTFEKTAEIEISNISVALPDDYNTRTHTAISVENASADRPVSLKAENSNFEITGYGFLSVPDIANTEVDVKGITVKNVNPAQKIWFAGHGTYGDYIDYADYEAIENDTTAIPEETTANTWKDNKITIRRKEGFVVTAPTFANATEGYDAVTAKSISIEAVGGERTIKNVTVSGTDFELVGASDVEDVTVAADTQNTTVKIKPVSGLKFGVHTATITVTDGADNTFTTEVTFDVNTYASTQVVTTKEEFLKFTGYSQMINHPEVEVVELGADITLDTHPVLYPFGGKTLDLKGYHLTTTGGLTIRFGSYSDNPARYFTTGDFTIKDTVGTGIVTINNGSILIDKEARDTQHDYSFTIDGGTYETATNTGIIILTLGTWNANDVFDFEVLKGTFNDAGSSLVKSFITRGGTYAPYTQNTTFNFENVTINTTFGTTTFMSGFTFLPYSVDDVIPETHRLISPTGEASRSTDVSDVTIEPEAATKRIKIEKIECFEVKEPSFASAEYGYGAVTPKAIDITAVGSNKSIASVTVDNANFVITPGTPGEVLQDATNDSYTIAPKTGLSAGTHEAIITVTDTAIPANTYEAIVTFVVTKATPSYTVPIGLTATYGQTLADVTLPTVTGVGAWTWVEPLTTEVGDADNQTHEAVYTPEDTTNYKTVNANVTIAVARANQTFAAIAENKTMEYGQTLNYPFTLSTGDGNITYSSSSSEYVGVNEAGTLTANKVTSTPVTITVTAAETANYNVATITYTVAVTKSKLAKPTATTTTTFTFDNSAKTLDVNNVVPQITQTLGTLTETYVGSYSVTYGLKDTTNYCWSDDDSITPVTIDWSITPAESTLTKAQLTNYQLVKGQGVNLNTLVTLNPLAYSSDVTFALVGTPTGISIAADEVLSATEEAATGEVKVKVSFAGKSLGGSTELEYSAATELELTIDVVDKPSQTFDKTSSPINMEYGSTRDNAYTVTTENGGAVTYSSSNTDYVVVDANGKLTAKKATTTPVTITVTAQGTATHAETSLTYGVSVSVKDVTVTAGTYKVTKIYDGTTNPVAGNGELSIVGILEGDTEVTITATPGNFSKADCHTGTGNVSLALSGTGNENYNLTNSTVSVPYTISSKDITSTINVEVTGTYTYTGSSIEPTIVVKDGSTIIANTEYTVGYESNINVGTAAKVIVSVNALGKNNYVWTPKTQTFEIKKANYTGTLPTLNKEVLENNEKSYEIGLEEITLPIGFVNTNIANATKSGELIKSVSNTSSKVTYTVNSKPADTTGILTLTISSQNYNDVNITVNVTAVSKTPVTLGGLTYTDKKYDESAIAPTGELTFTVAGSPVASLSMADVDVRYTGRVSTTYSSSTAPTNAGKYTATYTIKSSNESYTGTVSYDFEITKVQITKPELEQTTFYYTGVAIDVPITNKPSETLVTFWPTSINDVNDDLFFRFEINDTINYEWVDETIEDVKLYFSIKPAITALTRNSKSNKLTQGKDVDLKTLVNLDPSRFIDEVTFTTETLPTGVTLEGTTLKAATNATLGAITIKANFAGFNDDYDAILEYAAATELTFDVEITRKLTPGGASGGSVTEYDIEVEAGEGGTIKATPTSVEKGEDAKIKVSAYEGYEIEDVIVDDESVGAVKEYVIRNVRKDIKVKAIFKEIGKVDDTSVKVEKFKDVKPDDWFYDAVKFAVEHNLMNGTSEDTFAPNKTTTRAMIVTILYRLENEPNVTTSSVFDDVEDDTWYSKAIAWANENEIVLGNGNGKFNPNAEITREQLVTILYRYASYKKLNTSAEEDTNILSYEDAFETSEYAMSAFQWACGEGLVTGVSDDALAPKGKATRAQIATIMMRFMENM